MHKVQQLIEKVETIASTRPSYSLPNFLPDTVVELSVLMALEEGGQTGQSLIRELTPLSRRANGYGVHYPLLHTLEAAGTLMTYRTSDSNQRYYSLTEAGQVRLNELRQEYAQASAEQFQTGLQIVSPFVSLSRSVTVEPVC